METSFRTERLVPVVDGKPAPQQVVRPDVAPPHPVDEHVGTVASDETPAQEPLLHTYRLAANPTAREVIGTVMTGALGGLAKLALKAMALLPHKAAAAGPVNLAPQPKAPGIGTKVGDFIYGKAGPVGEVLLRLPLTEYDTPAVVDQRVRKLEYHHEQVGDGDIQRTIDIDTPERVQFRKDLVNDMYGQGAAKKERKAWVMIGMPACGKSTLSVPLAEREGAMDIDGDDIRDRIPEWNETHSFSYINAEKKLIQDAIIERCAENGDNVIFQYVPGIGIGSVQGPMKALRDKGYEVHLMYLKLPTEKAIERSMGRFEATGRFIDPLVELLLQDGPDKTFDSLKNSPLVDDWQIYSTDVPKGQQPILESEGKSTQTA